MTYKGNEVLRIKSGTDITCIEGAVPVNIGEGFKFHECGETYTTTGVYTKDGKRIVNIEVSSFIGISCRASHYYANLRIRIKNASEVHCISGYIEKEIPKEFKTIKGEFVRPLMQEEINENPGRWDGYEAGDLVNAFPTLEELEATVF